MSRLLRSVLLVATIAILAFVGSLLFIIGWAVVSVRSSTAGLPCTRPPTTFVKADLVGTWRAGPPEQSDVLEIRPDGTYQQRVHIESSSLPSIDYTSRWLAWSLEARENGIPYLHLEGFTLCGFNPDIPCSQVGGGGHDFCENKSVPMVNEGIILVLGAPRPLIALPGSTFARRGITLWFPAGSENTWAYDLESP